MTETEKNYYLESYANGMKWTRRILFISLLISLIFSIIKSDGTEKTFIDIAITIILFFVVLWSYKKPIASFSIMLVFHILGSIILIVYNIEAIFVIGTLRLIMLGFLINGLSCAIKEKKFFDRLINSTNHSD
jgi:hypothetical protein